MKLIGLSRQLAIVMGAIAVGVVVLVVATSVVFYHFAFKLWPDDYTESWAPTIAEMAWLTATTLAGVALAVFIAGHLAKRILVPLNSVALAIRSVADGDLEARASAGSSPLAEATMLVDDFNSLADELKRVTEERSFWNAAIAHELRTPVTILRGRLQGLLDGIFEADQDQFRRLLIQVEGLSRLIEDLRSISLAESGNLNLQWQSVDLRGDVVEVVESFKAPFEAAGLRVSIQTCADTVSCDRIRIRQVLIALLDNARRYAQPGTITVKTYLEGDHFVVSVEDQGPGVDPQMIPHVFEAFRRGGQIRDPSERSNGLGLAIVAAIAHAHGGEARCVPVGNGGTQFQLSWPARRPVPQGA